MKQSTRSALACLLRDIVREEVHAIIDKELKDKIQLQLNIELPKLLKNSYKEDELTLKELCETYKISKTTVYRHRQLGLETFTRGKAIWFKKEAIEKYFKQLNN